MTSSFIPTVPQSIVISEANRSHSYILSAVQQPAVGKTGLVSKHTLINKVQITVLAVSKNNSQGLETEDRRVFDQKWLCKVEIK